MHMQVEVCSSIETQATRHTAFMQSRHNFDAFTFQPPGLLPDSDLLLTSGCLRVGVFAALMIRV